MDKKQKQQRQQAAYQFIQSLNELGTVLQPDSEGAEAASPASDPGASSGMTKPRPSPPTWESALDDAAKDIEQFMSDGDRDA